MSALLHCICEGIERDRVRAKIAIWRLKQLRAKLSLIEAMEKHLNTASITYDEDGGIDLWEELRDFEFTSVVCSNYPICKTGIYYRYQYKLYWEETGWTLEEEDPNDYNYYCWGCFKQQKVLKIFNN